MNIHCHEDVRIQKVFESLSMFLNMADKGKVEFIDLVSHDLDNFGSDLLLISQLELLNLLKFHFEFFLKGTFDALHILVEKSVKEF